MKRMKEEERMWGRGECDHRGEEEDQMLGR